MPSSRRWCPRASGRRRAGEEWPVRNPRMRAGRWAFRSSRGSGGPRRSLRPLRGEKLLEHHAFFGNRLELQSRQAEQIEGSRRAPRCPGDAEPGEDSLGPAPGGSRFAALRRHARPGALQAAIVIDHRAVLLIDALARKGDLAFDALVLGDGDEDLERLLEEESVGAEGDQGLDALDAVVERDARSSGRQLDAPPVGILVLADEEIIAVAVEAGGKEILLRSDPRAEIEGRRGLFIGALRGERNADAGLSRDGPEELDRARQIALLHPLLVRLVMGEPALVAHPDLVDLFVAAREQPVDEISAALQIDVAAVGAAGADRRALLYEPDPRLKAEIAVQESSDRADVDGVARVLAVERLPGEGADQGVRAAVHHRQLRLLRDLVHEAHAAGAHDAALSVVDDQRPEDLALGLVQLGSADARGLVIELHVIILELAFARLIADGAID